MHGCCQLPVVARISQRVGKQANPVPPPLPFGVPPFAGSRETVISISRQIARGNNTQTPGIPCNCNRKAAARASKKARATVSPLFLLDSGTE